MCKDWRFPPPHTFSTDLVINMIVLLSALKRTDEHKPLGTIILIWIILLEGIDSDAPFEYVAQLTACNRQKVARLLLQVSFQSM